MEVVYRAISLEPTKYSDININVNEVPTCPRCKKSIKPHHLSSVYYVTADKIVIVESHLLCKGCNSSFLAHYELFKTPGGLIIPDDPVYTAPNIYSAYQFDENINDLSPQFVRIYNQALSAESSNLDEIAGLGFRKSLEFLIKDFAISEHPSDEEAIKSMMLSPCIKKYIDDSRIKVLAEKSAWIGNDEAHYIRKQNDRDITDMKAFIKAAVYFISMVLITNDAETIEPK